MSVKGITRRWLMSSLGLTVAILTSVALGFGFLIREYFYEGIRRTLDGRSSEFAAVFRGLSFQTREEFRDTARSYVEEFVDRDTMHVAVFDEYDEFIAATDGFAPDPEDSMPDGKEAEISARGYGTWTGKSPSGEVVMAFTRRACDQSGNYVGSVRYRVSLRDADYKIFASTLVLVLFSILIVIFVVFAGNHFIKSIINPVMEISETAKLIAQGNFTIKIGKKYDDEIGELCDTVNYMAEELGTAERMKNDFISSVSHEIRTPLTAIKGWAETMQLEDLTDKSVIERGLDVIVRETERLSGIVEELLDFSRLQSGRMAVSMDKLDLLAELGEAVYMFKERAAAENKSLIYNEPKMLSPIMGDRNRLKQVFINVIDNSLKYTSEGGGVSVSVAEKDGEICVTVTDNGCGIPKRHLPRVTEKFYKANSVQRGSGIGLAIVSEIIDMHGGSLAILSEEGFGTTVNISFPVVKEEPGAEAPKDARA